MGGQRPATPNATDPEPPDADHSDDYTPRRRPIPLADRWADKDPAGLQGDDILRKVGDPARVRGRPRPGSTSDRIQILTDLNARIDVTTSIMVLA